MPKIETQKSGRRIGGLAGWLLSRLERSSRPRPSLALLERITLAPRQSLSLVEAEGRRFLIATSAEGAPAFYALGERGPETERARRGRTGVRARASW